MTAPYFFCLEKIRVMIDETTHRPTNTSDPMAAPEIDDMLARTHATHAHTGERKEPAPRGTATHSSAAAEGSTRSKRPVDGIPVCSKAVAETG